VLPGPDHDLLLVSEENGHPQDARRQDEHPESHAQRSCTNVIESDLRSKHGQVRENLFLFFRGSFYRWAQLWPEICPELRSAPKVLAVGDLHVGSFGTWRDAEGRVA